MRLETQESLKAYFADCLAKASDNQRLPLNDVTRVYLIHLLEKAIDATKIFASADSGEVDEPLALLLGRASASGSTLARLDLLRQIGDRSLFLSGFFSDSFHRRAVDIDYYIAMGGHAYRGASNLVEDRYADKLFPEVFAELAAKFRPLVDVLGEISEMAGLTQDQDLLRLYERWNFTRSERLGAKLRAHGIVPVSHPGKDEAN